jgi:hypothetical protein
VRTIAPAAAILNLARVVTIEKGKITVEVRAAEQKPELAQTVVPHSDLEPDDQVVVARLGGPGSELVILGRLINPEAPARDVRINGRRVSFEADSEIILKCASATIRIARDGLVAVRGDRVTTQARGTNRIRGGSVEIN